ncbi:MAG: DUF3078 domain-containing protein [Flavobacteriales bacterium]
MKFRILHALLVFLTSCITLFAQDDLTPPVEDMVKRLDSAGTGWTFKGAASSGLTGTYFSHWAAGGINSMGINGQINMTLNYRKNHHTWDNALITAFGLVNQGFEGRESWIKTDDRLDLTSKYGKELHESVYLTGLFNFNTQYARGFAPGSNGRPDRTKLISNFFSPARLLFSLGVDAKPHKSLSLFFSPITFRGIYVFDDLLAAQGAFGMKPGIVATDTLSDGSTALRVVQDGAHTRNEVGAYLRLNFVKTFNDRFSLNTRLELFCNYLDKPENVDLAWENIVGWKVNKYLSLNTSLYFIYDDNTTITRTKSVSETTGNETVTRTITYSSKGLQTRYIQSLGVSFVF